MNINMRPSKRMKLLDEDESDSDDAGGVLLHAAGPSQPGNEQLHINQEFAKRFEHNKKRDELAKCKSGHFMMIAHV